MPVQLSSPGYNMDDQKIPAVNVSASQDSTGAVYISIVNLNPNNTITVKISLNDVKWNSVTGQMITSSKVNHINTFERPDLIQIARFTGARKEGNQLVVKPPSKSVVVLALK